MSGLQDVSLESDLRQGELFFACKRSDALSQEYKVHSTKYWIHLASYAMCLEMLHLTWGKLDDDFLKVLKDIAKLTYRVFRFVGGVKQV